jgi:spore coat protein CotH
MAASMGNSGKVPFRLDFDRYEEEFPETRNQRFYGFQKLTFSSNLGDDSQMREVFATEVFRDRGVPAPRAAFYRVLVDTGSGFEYWGLYSLIEDVADGAMLDAQFGGRGGNLYKPEGTGANWSVFNAEGLGRKTNEKAADFSDVQSAIAALHAERTDPHAWRAALEATFDVDLFLRWLAVNTVIQNWDAYGAMAHNYYLYGDPAQKGRLRWIPWDNNFALGAGFAFPVGARPGGPGGPGGPPPGQLPFGRGGGRGGRGGFGGSGTDLLHAQVGSEWPLIQRLMADEVYAARYREQLAHALGGLVAPDAAEARLRALHALIAPAIVGERGERPNHTTVSSPEAFERSVDGPDGLVTFIRGRHEAVRAALDGQNVR